MTFTVEQVDEMVGEYSTVLDEDYNTRTEKVKELADRFGFSEAKVRGKLVSEGVYKKKEEAEKKESDVAGGKAGLVKAFEAVVGQKLESLNKATKKDLETLWNWIKEASDQKEANSQ